MNTLKGRNALALRTILSAAAGKVRKRYVLEIVEWKSEKLPSFYIALKSVFAYRLSWENDYINKSIIHPFSKLFSAFKKRQFFRSHINGLSSFGISAVIWLIFFYKKSA